MPKTHLLALTVISFAALFIHGYAFSTGDQSIYIPQVLMRLNPSLYSQDYFVNHLPESRFSLFFPLMAGITRLTRLDLQSLYFGFYLLNHLLITFIIYSLSLTLTGKHSIALLATALLSLPKFVGGTTITTLDIAWLPRFAVLPLFLFGLQQLILNKTKLTFLIAFILGLFHPFSGLLLLLTSLGHRVILISLLPLTLLLLLSRWTMPPAWYSLLADRVPYNFMSLWQFTGWASLSLTLILSAAFLLVSRRDSSVKLLANFLKASLLTALTITLAHVLLGEIGRFIPILQLQLLRIWLIPTYLSFIASAWLVVNLWRRSWVYRLIAVLVFFILATNLGTIKPGPVEFPGHNYREWDQLQVWAKANTPTDSLFLTLPHRIGFRIHSQRAIVAEIKDGSSGLYSRELAFNWQQRINDTHPLAFKSAAEIIKLKQKYQADYLVTFNQVIYQDFTPVFKTDTFIIYNLRDISE